MQSDITFRCDDGFSMPGVLVGPDTDEPRPALLLVYEVFGMSEEMLRVARELSEEGWRVLIPDLFARGRVKTLCIASAMRTLSKGAGRELSDLESARRWLSAQPGVDAERVGAIGFCMGGSFALVLAGTGLYKVSAPFYGRPTEMERSCPVVASFGGRDASAGDGPARLVANLDRLGAPHDVKTYPEAGHGFYTRTGGLIGVLGPHLPIHAGYHAASAEDARRRMLAFFHEHLDG